MRLEVVALAVLLAAPTLVASAASAVAGATVDDADRFRPGDESVSAAEDPEVDDPDDDARVYNTGAAYGIAGCHGSWYEPVWCETEGAGPTRGGVPAPPALEMTSVDIEDTARDLVVRFEVERFTDDLSEAAPEGGDKGVTYGACWGEDREGCDQVVNVQLRRRNGDVHAISSYFDYTGRCSQAVPCAWTVPHEIHTGEPGVVEWRIPREVLPNASAGDELETTAGYVYRIEEHQRSTRVQVGPEEGYVGAVGAYFGYTVDYTDEPGEPFAFQQVADGGVPDRMRGPSLEDNEGDVPGGEAPDLDVLEVRLIDEPGRFGAAVKKAEVRETPREHGFGFALGFGQEIPLVNAYYNVQDGRRQVSGGACPDGTCENYTSLDVEVSVQTGSPGWINLTYPDADPGSDRLEGLELTWMAASTWQWEDQAPEFPGSEFVGQGPQEYRYDSVYPGTVYRVGGEDTATETTRPSDGSSLDDGGLSSDDDASDASLPASTAPTVDERSFEITRLRLKAESPSTTVARLSIENLERVEVPPSWDAVFYATAVEVPEGRFMAGYYKEDPAVGTDRQKFLCATDTAVLQEPPRDPNQVVWTTIDGNLNLGQESQGQSGDGSDAAQITLEVPRECLGRTPPGPVEVSDRGAGTFLIRNPGGQQAQVERVDGVRDEENATLESRDDALATAGAGVEPSFWTRPFGVENFWDITGIAGTVLASVVGAVLVRRRRSVLKDYLEEIEDVEQAHADDPTGRQAALREIRSRAKDDLVDGRLTENQYVVVKDRIEEIVSQARVEGLEEAFGGLPHRLLTKLKEMLHDGRLSPEDRRLFLTMLEDSGLNEQARDRVRRKLDVWTQADADRAEASA